LIDRKTLANLYYKKALKVSSKTEAESLLEKANEIMHKIIRNTQYSDPYSYHIFGKGNYNYIIHWIKGKENIRAALKGLQNPVNQGCDYYPGNRSLNILKAALDKAILLTAVNGAVKYPAVYSDFDK